jgi:hypothetical protein
VRAQQRLGLEITDFDAALVQPHQHPEPMGAGCAA